MMVGGLASGSPTMVDFNASHFEREIVVAVRWYVAYPISHRQLEAMMEERDVKVDHSSLNRWVIKYLPLLDQAFRVRKRRGGGGGGGGGGWRMDEPCVRIRGRWKHLYRAVDKTGDTVDFLPTAKRDRKAALRFLCKAVGRHGTPAKITIEGSGANAVAIEDCNEEHDAEVEIWQVKYLNNVIEQDDRAIKR
jgi:putative transposase